MDTFTSGVKDMLEGESSGFGNFFRLDSNQEAVVRILPFPPYRFLQHTAFINGKFRSFPCSAKSDPEGKCIGCYLVNRGDKRVNTRKVALYEILDLRKMHVLDMGIQGEQIYYCTADPRYGTACSLCNQGNRPVWAGRKVWQLPPFYLQAIFQHHLEMNLFCRTCGVGAIRVKALMCPECKADIFPPDKLPLVKPIDLARIVATSAICPSCRKKVVPVETIECSSRCKNPMRAGIHDVDLKVQKIKQLGKSGASYWTLVVNKVENSVMPIPKEFLDELNKPSDLANMCKPPSLDKQASILGIPNPFASPADYGPSYASFGQPVGGVPSTPPQPPQRTMPSYPGVHNKSNVPDGDLPINFPESEEDIPY